jgi:hypothetical protein
LWKLLAEQDDCIKQPFYALEGGEIEKSVFFGPTQRPKNTQKNFSPPRCGFAAERGLGGEVLMVRWR